jgi:hypothetical protein
MKELGDLIDGTCLENLGCILGIKFSDNIGSRFFIFFIESIKQDHPFPECEMFSQRGDICSVQFVNKIP